MSSTEHAFAIVDVTGPFREPREQVFSYDYSIQRSTWPTPHGVRVKVSIPEELEVMKRRLFGMIGGSPGQQLMLSNILSKTIADRKMRVAEEEGMLTERRDVMVPPFAGSLAHLFPKLEAFLVAEQSAIQAEVKRRAGL
ncbi:MAG: hypothetical protein A4E19_03860 [Nitrospira sp. SG-bin1]|nr:MAG: hypothetical protein A4E19_03860 [Nitrospira sp. SG-bin1]